jgi:hypothetical protein
MRKDAKELPEKTMSLAAVSRISSEGVLFFRFRRKGSAR